MNFSERTDFGSVDPTYEQLLSITRTHDKFIDLTASSPLGAGVELPHPLAWFEHVPPTYDPDPRGLMSAREALASSYSTRASVNPEQFVLTASTSEAYSFVLTILCNPGDRILVPSPSYPLFEQLARIAGVEPVRYRIGYDGAFFTDLGTLPSRERAEAERIRAIFAVSPNNPTGNSLRPEELERLTSLQIPLVIDEVFRPYSSKGDMVDPLLVAAGQRLLILVDGLSKRAAAPGLKLGWMLVCGQHADAFLERAEWVSDAFLSAGSFVQHALPKILEEESLTQDRVRARLETCRRILTEARLPSEGISLLETDGGFTALLRLPGTSSEETWWRWLCKDGLWLQPGRLYDMEQTPVFAVSLLTPPDLLLEALERLIAIVRRRK